MTEQVLTKTPGLDWLEEDRLHEECGVFGIFNHPDAAALTALGLHALQHRGQEAAGIVSFDGHHFHTERRVGLVGDHFTSRPVIERLKGDVAIGHVRYSTCGDPVLRNVQPLFVDLDSGGFSLGHNGNLTNALTLRESLIKKGAICQSTTDTEVILHLVARSEKQRFVEAQGVAAACAEEGQERQARHEQDDEAVERRERCGDRRHLSAARLSRSAATTAES